MKIEILVYMQCISLAHPTCDLSLNRGDHRRQDTGDFQPDFSENHVNMVSEGGSLCEQMERPAAGFWELVPQPGASKKDAFSLCWKGLQTFFPHKIIPRCLSKVIMDQAEVVMVTPYWLSQSWFLDMMELSSDVSRHLPPA